MGTRAFIELGERLGILPADREARRPIGLGIDVPLLLITLTLLILGLVMVYSASWDFSYQQYGDPVYTFRRQVNWILLGICSFVVMSVVNYRWWSRLALPLMGVTVLMLAMVLFLKDTRFGASRSLLGGSYQPSELSLIHI